MAVWRRGGTETKKVIPIASELFVSEERWNDVTCVCAYPQKESCRFSYDGWNGSLTVEFLDEICARVFELSF